MACKGPKIIRNEVSDFQIIIVNLIDHIMKACRQNWRAGPEGLHGRMARPLTVEEFSARESIQHVKAAHRKLRRFWRWLATGWRPYGFQLLFCCQMTQQCVKWITVAIFYFWKIAQPPHYGFFKFWCRFYGIRGVLQYSSGGIRLRWYVSCKICCFYDGVQKDFKSKPT